MDSPNQDKKSFEERKQELWHKTFLMMFKILVVFGLPAVIAYFLGGWLDQKFSIEPYGTVGVLAAAFIFSWAIVLKMYFNLSEEYKQLEQESNQKDQ